MSNRKSRNLSLLRNYRVDCDEKFWDSIKEALRKTPADEEFDLLEQLLVDFFIR